MAEKPWLAQYPEGVDWHARFEAKPLYRLLDDAAQDWPERPHLDFMGRQFAYRETRDLVNRAAKGLQGLGVGKGVRVGLFLPNCPQFVICYYAALKAGGTVVALSPLYSARELLDQVEDSQTDIVVTLDLKELYPKIARVFEESRLQTLVVSSLADVLPPLKALADKLFRPFSRARIPDDDCHIAYTDLLDTDGAVAEPDLDLEADIAALQFTGGTTGTPKAAMLTHANLSINAAQSLAWDPENTPGEEVMLGALPFFHIFAMTLVMNASTLGGAEIVLMPKFELKQALKLVERKRVSLMPGVPTMFTAMLNDPETGKRDLSSLRSCFSGGAPLPAEVKRGFEKAAGGVVVNEGYGLTEASPTVSSNPIRGKAKAGSIGLPMPATEIVILDQEDQGKALDPGETGEICVRGPQVMKGYADRPEETAEVFIGDLLRTGDLGYMDEEGYTFLVDRAKDLIISGGFNIYPRTVEEAIYEHPAVQEAAVIGVPDEYYGESPKAVVVLKPEQTLEPERLKAFLRERLGKHEIPHSVEVRDSLPKTTIGKIDKKALAAQEREK